MRVKLTFHASKQATLLPLNYNYAVASLIYSTLNKSSIDFAARLHDKGFDDEGRKFKLFTFSRLNTQRTRVVKDYLLLEDSKVSFQVSSPISDFIEHFVTGLFQWETFNIAGADFYLENAETLAAPEFISQMDFRALSPITETTKEEGAKHARYLDLKDDWSKIIQHNLIHKHKALLGCSPSDESLRWIWDQDYIAEAEKRGRRLSVLTDIHGIKVRGWLAPFIVEGSRELIELGYEAGFGSRNSMGFGMAG